MSLHPALSSSVYRILPHRMLANAGYPVLELKRERYGNILLGGLAEGDHAPVSGEALEWAKSVFQLKPATVDNGSDYEGKGAALKEAASNLEL